MESPPGEYHTFLSSLAQDFIEVNETMTSLLLFSRFLSSLAQDFIEVCLEFVKLAACIGIPELSSSGLH